MARSNESEAVRFVLSETKRAWRAVAPGLRRRGTLSDRTALGLVFCCQQFAQYRLLLVARSRWPDDQEIAVALEQARLRPREIAADFALVRPGRQQLTALSATGEDVELRRIFGRPA